MRLVIDANIVISALLGSRHTYDIIESGKHTLFAPEALLQEISSHKQTILTRTRLTLGEADQRLAAITALVRIIPESEYACYLRFVTIRDEDDAAYVACALACEAGIWSNDKDLHAQDMVPAFTTRMLCL